jgi:hypothetical protein
MKISKHLSRKEFREHFGTQEQCLTFLSSEKWKSGYACLKCKKKGIARTVKSLVEGAPDVDMMSKPQQIHFSIK